MVRIHLVEEVGDQVITVVQGKGNDYLVGRTPEVDASMGHLVEEGEEGDRKEGNEDQNVEIVAVEVVEPFFGACFAYFRLDLEVEVEVFVVDPLDHYCDSFALEG